MHILYRRRKAPIKTLSPNTYVKRAFPDWIIEYCSLDACVLDIGAGKDRNQTDATIQPRVLRLVLHSLKVIKDRGEVVIEEGPDYAEKEESPSQTRVKRR